MKITCVLFDLDGTLLPMNQEKFTNGYFKMLVKKLSPYGYEPQQLINTIWAGTKAMMENDGSKSNEEAFWEKFGEAFGQERLTDKDIFDDFYTHEFEGAKRFCKLNPKAVKAVKKIKQMGYRLALATNPIFPNAATETRIRWAGLEPSDFEFYTSYENIGYCKPNLDYYRELLRRLDVVSEECLMVGNDVTEDMIAQELGIGVYLLTDCLINKERRDISQFPRGGYDHLLRMVEEV